MNLTICTGAWGPKAKSYLESFLPGMKLWPREVRFLIYTDALPPGFITAFGNNPEEHLAWARSMHDLAGWETFMATRRTDPIACGRQQRSDHHWKDSAVRGGYNFRFDAVGFAGQGFVPEAAAVGLQDGEILCWMDADVIAHTPVPEGFIEGLVGKHDGAYLGRGLKHSEIGFWAVKISPRTREFLFAFADAYRSQRVFCMGEWHSAYVWDETRREMERHGRPLNMRNLTPRGHGHVWHQSPLGLYLDHLKGDRKALGRSPERRK